MCSSLCHNNILSNANKKHYLLCLNDLLCWIKWHVASCSSSEVNSGLFLSACLFQKMKSSLDELDESSHFVDGGDVGVYMSACLT